MHALCLIVGAFLGGMLMAYLDARIIKSLRRLIDAKNTYISRLEARLRTLL